MGSGVGTVLHQHGARVLTCLAGRGAGSRERAAQARLRRRGRPGQSWSGSPTCCCRSCRRRWPARSRTRSRPRFGRPAPTCCTPTATRWRRARLRGSPRTLLAAGARFADAGIIGPPPTRPGNRIFASGPGARELEALRAFRARRARARRRRRPGVRAQDVLRGDDQGPAGARRRAAGRRAAAGRRGHAARPSRTRAPRWPPCASSSSASLPTHAAQSVPLDRRDGRDRAAASKTSACPAACSWAPPTSTPTSATVACSRTPSAAGTELGSPLVTGRGEPTKLRGLHLYGSAGAVAKRMLRLRLVRVGGAPAAPRRQSLLRSQARCALLPAATPRLSFERNGAPTRRCVRVDRLSVGCPAALMRLTTGCPADSRS